MSNPLPVAVLGAGPVGLAAAAHLSERGLPFIIFESGDSWARASGVGATCGCSPLGAPTSIAPRNAS